MKRFIATILSIALMCSFVPAAFAASNKETQAAQALYDLGLFQGTGNNADGTPNFDLDRAPTRAEAVTMLVRLLGKDAEAKAGSWTTPFTDVADWAKPYVGYAYTNGLTTGTSATTFGGEQTIDATQYLTLVLRALDYTSGTDFQWDSAWTKSDEIGLTEGQYHNNGRFTRGHVASISYTALTTAIKDTSTPLYAENGISMGPSIDGLQRLNIGPARAYGHIEFAEYQEKRYILPFASPWDVRVATLNGDPYDYDDDSFALIFEPIFIGESDNPYVDGVLQPSTMWGFYEQPRGYEYLGERQYISATETLQVFTITYNGKTFHSITAEEFNAAGLKDGDSGIWNGVRFVVELYSTRSYTCYNLNDLAEYFGVERTLKVVDGRVNGEEPYWVISE